MPKKMPAGPEYVKKQTVWTVGAVCLIVGFFAGVLLTIYKSGDQFPNASQQASQNVGAGSNLTEIIRMLERETSNNPENTRAWIELGNSYFDSNQYPKAIVAYEKALGLDPKNANVWTDLGVMYRRNGQSQKAVDAFDQAVKVDPNHQTARYNKGIVLLHDLKDNTGAIQVWEELLKINPQAKTPTGQPLGEMIRQFKQN